MTAIATSAHDRLPAAIEAEKQVLGAILLLPEILPELRRTLRSADFLDLANRAIFRAIERLQAAGQPIEFAMLVEALRDNPEFRGDGAGCYLLEVSQSVATAAHAEHYAKLIVEARRKRQLLGIAEQVADGAMNGRASAEIINNLCGDVDDLRREVTGGEAKYRGISAAELATAKYHVTYIVDRLFVEDQPCVLGGPKKALKTSMAIDLALSIATGGFFLGKFPVINRRRVLLGSGESGMAVNQETAFRVCRAMGIDLKKVDGFTMTPNLPRLNDATDVLDFRQFVGDNGAQVVILDPCFLMMSGDDAGNLFKQGALLRNVTDVCQELGATLILCHHTKSTVANPYAAPELDNLSWSGFAEFARQWLLIGRREQYEPGTGTHRLWLSVGGSAGHGGLWACGVDEGTIDDPGGRRWEVAVHRADEARTDAERRRADSKASTQQSRLAASRVAVCRVLAKHPGGMTQTNIRDHAGISGRHWPAVLADMLERGELLQVDIKTGNQKTTRTGYRLIQNEGA